MAERALPQPAEEKDLPSPRHLEALPGGRQAKELSDPLVDLENAKTIRDAMEIMEALKNKGVLAKVKKEHRDLYQPTAGNEKTGRAVIDAYIKTLRRIRNAEQESHKNKSPETHIQKTRDQAKKTIAHSKPEAKKPRFFPLYITLSNDQTYNTPSDFERFYQALNKQNPKKAHALREEYISQLKDRVALIQEESEQEAKRIARAERIKHRSDQDRPGVRDMVKLYEGVWITQNPQGRYEPLVPAAQPLTDAANKRILELEQGHTKKHETKPELAKKNTSPEAAIQDSLSEPKATASATKTPDPIQKDEQELSKMIKAHPELKIITRLLHAYQVDKPASIHPSLELRRLSEILKESFTWDKTITPSSLRDLAIDGIEPDLETFKKIAAYMESEIKKLPTENLSNAVEAVDVSLDSEADRKEAA